MFLILVIFYLKLHCIRYYNKVESIYDNLARVLIAVTTIRLGEPSHAVLKFVFNFMGFLN